MFFKKLTHFVLTISLCGALNCAASDDKREAEFATDVQKTLNIGHAVWLESSGKKFLSLYTETAKNPRSGVIILLHDTGGHPNQQAIIKSLRTFFPEHHWATLSLQMPIREASAPVDDYFSLMPEAKARLKAGIQFAKTEKAEKIVVIGYGLGSLMASSALTEKNDDVNALITISLPVPETREIDAQTLKIIPKITLPMLDIYGAADMPNVVNSARERQVAGKINPKYRQMKLDDEGHFYLHDEGLLVKRLYSWIDKVTQDLPH
jgi:pimeloyl-ACP methyl ester carboxylesterase